MAKVKIIDSYSLECLISGIHLEIEEANSRIVVFVDELENEQRHRQDEKTIDRISKAKSSWCVRRDILEQCLCKIQMQIKEIEI